MPRSRGHKEASVLRSCHHHARRDQHSSPDNVSITRSARPSRSRTRPTQMKLRDPTLQEAKQIILQLKGKLEERHSMAAKIVDLDKSIQRINESSNDMLVEMENRVDDLNRDWQRRIRNENSKWQERVEQLHKQRSSQEDVPTLSGDPTWRIERRLLSIEKRLRPVEQIDKNVIALAEMSENDLHTARGKPSSLCRSCANRERRPSLYGVVEMTETYSMCVRNLERAIKSLSDISKMPAVIGNVPNGVNSVADVQKCATTLGDFVRKLKTSLRESHFCGSPEEPDWDE